MTLLLCVIFSSHLVIQADANQTYLGVSLSGDAESVEPGDEVRVFVRPLYDNVDYSGLTRGVTFLIKEGAQSMGQGMVL